MKLTIARFIALACIGGCQLLPPIQVSQSLDQATTAVTTVTSEAENGMSKDLIRDRGKLISLRVYSVHAQEWKDNGLILNESGSGVLMAMEPTPANPSVYQYLVLTANHVAKESTEKGKEAEFYIRTPDGLIHKARRHLQKFKKTDLALLSFYSPYRYEVAVIAKKQSLKLEDPIYITGFPCDLGLSSVYCPAEFVLIQGKVKAVLTEPLVDNYSIGYSNEVVEGTSGGPILNTQGELVGINGRREGGPSSQYKRADGSESTKDDIQQMKNWRWGIPIDFYIKLDTKKLFKEIPPLNQEFVPMGYIAKSDSQTNQSKQTPYPDPNKSSGVTPENHYLWLKLLVGVSGMLGTLLLLRFFLDTVSNSNSKGSIPGNPEVNYSNRNTDGTPLVEGGKSGRGYNFIHHSILHKLKGIKHENQEQRIANISFTSVRQRGYNFIDSILHKLKGIKHENQEQRIANISFTSVPQRGFKVEILYPDMKTSQTYDLFYEDSLKTLPHYSNKWLKCEINGFTIFIKEKISTGGEANENLVVQLESSDDYCVKHHDKNLYLLCKKSKKALSKIILIEFVFQSNALPIISPQL